MKLIRDKKGRIVLATLAFIILLMTVIQFMIIASFNSTVRISEGRDTTRDSYMDIHFRGGNTATWIKREEQIFGSTYDGTFFNNSSDIINSWKLRIDIHGNCWINQFWNGTVEVHQHAGDGSERVQLLDLADYDTDSLILDYRFSDTDLLIPLREGDFIIYYPSEKVGEAPIQPFETANIGTIFYYANGIDLSDYRVEYFYHREFTQGPLFIVICVLAFAWVVLFGMHQAMIYAIKNAEKEMEYRKAGIACMSEIYAIIYIVDLVKDTITPVGVDEESDRYRPKDMGANAQFQNLFRTDAAPAYREVMMEFAELTTIPTRMEKRNSIALEYESVSHGWCRIRFIAMDRVEGVPLEKVLFTIEEISEEKKELDRILGQVEKAESESRAKSVFVENMSREIWSPLASIRDVNEEIIKVAGEKEVLTLAKKIRQDSGLLLFLVNSILDYSKLEAGKLSLQAGEYSLRHLMDSVVSMVGPGVESKHLALETEITESLPDRLVGDEGRLQQSLVNMVSHAVHHTEKGSIKIAIYGKVLEDQKVHLLFSVKDTASNLHSERDKERIGKKRSMEEEAASLAYSLADGLVSLMGGELKVVGVYGNGNDTYFEIEQESVGSENVGKR